MMFLEELMAERARSIKLRELLLLLVRAGMLLCLVLAMMRPTIKLPSGMARPPDVHTSAVLLLDDSFSMNVGRAKTAWQDAREQSLQYIDTLRKGDDVTVMLASQAGKGPAPAALFDLERAREQLRQAAPAHGEVDIPRALAAAVQQLDTRHNPRRELVLIGDLRRPGWHADDGARWSFLASLAGSSRVRPQIIFTQVGPDRPANVALTGLTLSRQVVDPFADVTFYVSVANEGPEKASDVAVTFTVDGAIKTTRQVELPPGGRETVPFTHRFDKPGSHLASFKLRAADDELPDDNELLHSVVVIDRLPVLLVDGDRSTQPLGSETDFLKLALAPGADQEDGPWRTVIEPEIMDVTELRYADLSKYRVVVLANTAALPGATVSELERFVVAGGGLLVALGNRVRSEAYNRDLYRQGAGLLPAPLTGLRPLKKGIAHPVAGRFRSESYVHLSGIVSNAPALDLFRPENGQDWSKARIHRYYATGAVADRDDVRVLATLSNGDAAVVEKKLGEGKVMLWSGAVDMDWSDLPVHPFYVPLMQNMVFDLASAVIPPRNLRVGQSVAYVATGEAARQPHYLYPPKGDPVKLAGRQQGALTVFTYQHTQQVGRYAVAPEGADQDARVYYTVNADRRESEMRRLDGEQLDSVTRDLDAHLARDWQDLARLIGLDSGGYEISGFLIVAALALCFVEIFLLRRWA